MATITHKGNTVHTSGELPRIGTKAPHFKLTKGDLSDVTLESFAGKIKILNIVPSLDTGTCAASARRFEKESATLQNVVILTISDDLPFAQKRFCEAEGITNVITLSSMRDRNFGKDYGLELTDGPLQGICSRSIVVIDKNNIVAYTEQVPETTHEPDYTKALEAVKKLS